MLPWYLLYLVCYFSSHLLLFYNNLVRIRRFTEVHKCFQVYNELLY